MNTAAGIAADHATRPLALLCDAQLAERDATFQDDIALPAARLGVP